MRWRADFEGLLPHTTVDQRGRVGGYRRRRAFARVVDPRWRRPCIEDKRIQFGRKIRYWGRESCGLRRRDHAKLRDGECR